VEGKAGEVLKILLDTDIVSQLIKDVPHPGVHAWLRGAIDEDLYLSAISVEEIREGIEMMDAGRRKRRLDRWLTDEVLIAYRERILPIEVEIADLCGRILATEEKAGFHPDVSDAYIAATARVHGMSVATLNRKHFERLGVKLVEF
jgi:predicted nucleic acid-binding protein